MSELAVSNDVLRESLRVLATPPLSTRLEQRMSAWLPTFERWLIGALYWFTERAAWQRGALSMAVGALIGLGMVFAGAGVFRAKRTPLAANAPALQAAVIAPAAVRPRNAPVPAAGVAAVAAPSVAPSPAPAVATAPEPAATEPLLEERESKPASKHAKKRPPRHRKARSSAGTWTFPRPQRRSP